MFNGDSFFEKRIKKRGENFRMFPPHPHLPALTQSAGRSSRHSFRSFTPVRVLTCSHMCNYVLNLCYYLLNIVVSSLTLNLFQLSVL